MSKAQQAFVSHHHGRKLAIRVKPQFKPKKGSKLKTTTTVLIG
jgi:hypothetical protein